MRLLLVLFRVELIGGDHGTWRHSELGRRSAWYRVNLRRTGNLCKYKHCAIVREL
jgi:hypothetical protein